jgi:hypothetical protein
MITGWQSDDYLILFEEQAEAIELTQRYGIHDRIPGHTLIGLRGWGNFILMSPDGHQKTVPTVPLTADELEDWPMPIDLSAIEHDSRVDGKIKWYVTPLIFGGSPTDKQNITWVTVDQHVDLVRWWNSKYDEIRNQRGEHVVGGNGG